MSYASTTVMSFDPRSSHSYTAENIVSTGTMLMCPIMVRHLHGVTPYCIDVLILIRGTRTDKNTKMKNRFRNYQEIKNYKDGTTYRSTTFVPSFMQIHVCSRVIKRTRQTDIPVFISHKLTQAKNEWIPLT